MIRRPSGTKTHVLRTILVAAACLAAVVTLGFSLQAEALGRPDRARLALVQTLHRLTEYHYSQATLELDGRRYSASCVDHWRTRTRVADVVVDGRRVLPEVDNRLRRTGLVAEGQFDLAGCPRPLGIWLATELVENAAVRLVAARADGTRVIELRLPSARPPLDLYVALRTHLPVELTLAGRRLRGTSDVSYGAVR
jgi:hypothetical protein